MIGPVLVGARGAEVSAIIAARTGLHFPEARWADMARALDLAGRDLGFGDAGASASWLTSPDLTTHQIETLACYLTVGETFFFRDHPSFDLFERVIVPQLVARRAGSGRMLRLWSAGTSTGEEAYSIAISCARTLPDPHTWDVSVLGTDINTRSLAKAEAGVYSEWSFREAPPWLRPLYFASADGKQYAIDPAIRQMVHFEYLNLADDVYPSLVNQTNAMDVIFCRNVLMYFTAAQQRRVVAGLHACLAEDGYLLVNPAEASSTLFPMFEQEVIGGALAYRKTSRPTRRPPAMAYAPSAAADMRVESSAVPAAVKATRRPAAPAAASRMRPKPIPPTQAPVERARTLANQGRLEEALACCTEAIAVNRTDATSHFLYAMICLELGRLDESAGALRRVLFLDPHFILAHHAMGAVQKQLGRTRESRRHLAHALDLLVARPRDEIVPDSGGMTCGRLVESVLAMREI